MMVTTATGAMEVGGSAPNCQLEPLGASQQFDLAALRGQVVYLDFWASWCAPCRKSFPFLNELDHEYRARGLRVIAVNVDEIRADADQFLRSHPTSFSLAADLKGECPRAFGVHGMPTSYLIDPNGVVRVVHGGFRDADRAALKAQILALIDEAAAAKSKAQTEAVHHD
ncbi:MAG: TlpA disulfide reductase family protein [Proteobacteria bacterium]|nr:TlpA disulfide reductase family protein [Pseudomonadota bacterium]